MAGELRIRLMGGLSVDGCSERELGSRKARTLLAMLAAARGEIVPVERAADALWGDALPAKPADQVGVLVSRLRAVLGADHLVRRSPGYALAGAWLDVEEIDRRVDDAVAAQTTGRLAAARGAADAALALVHGPLLPGEDGDWAIAARARVDARVATARRVRIEATFATGDWTAVVAQAEVLLADHPYDEAVLRTLMHAHAASGSIAGALAAYARARTRFVEDLGASPSAATEQLHTRLLVDPDSFATPAPSRGTPTDVIGRDAEVERLHGLLRQARQGEAVIAAVEGHAGIGKSSLLRAWIASTNDAEVLVARGYCDELRRDLPLAPIADAVADAARMAEPGALGDLDPIDRWLLATVLGVSTPGPPPPASPGGPGGSQMQLFAAVLHALEALTGERTTVLVIEDVHAGVDTSTLAWLAWSTHRARRLAVIVTQHPGRSAVPGAEVIPLGALDLAAVREIAGAERADELFARSGGHPLLLQALISAGDGEDVPVSIREVVDRELTAMRSAATTIRVAAVVGAEVDVDVIAAVQQAQLRDVLDDLDSAVAAGLLVEVDSGYRFGHELIRAAVRASLTSARLAFIHREAARALAARPRSDPRAMAFHARRGGDDRLAAVALATAARVAAGRYDLDVAEGLLGESLELERDPATLIERARLRMSRLDLDGATADADAALAAGVGPTAYEVLGWIAYYRRDHAGAGAMANAALALAHDAGERAGSLALSARVLQGRGDLGGALERFDEAARGPASTRQVTAVWHANALLHAGRPADALIRVEQAWLAPAAPHPFVPVHGWWAQTLALAFLGRIGDAFVALERMDELIERSGDIGRRFAGAAHNIRGYMLRQAGRLEAADVANHLALQHTSGPDGRPAAAAMVESYWVAHLDLADGRIAAGDPAGAAELVELMQPVDSWSGTMAWHQRHRLDLVRARLALLDDDRDGALELASTVSEDAARRGAVRYATLADATIALAGGTSDLDRIGVTVERLPGCAALEAWRLTAALGAQFDVDRWTAAAARHAGALVEQAGDLAGAFSAEVGRVLD